MSHRWLVLRLEAPLMAFGSVAVDHVRPTRRFPAASMIVGLIGNALGLHWRDSEAHQGIQDRLVFAACQEREGILLTDMQNAELAPQETGWTTRGAPVQRTGHARTYDRPHRRQREYRADASVRLVFRFTQTEAPPTLATVAECLDLPARPLFIGRKPCLPARPFVAPIPHRWVDAADAHAALSAVALGASNGNKRALWPVGEGPERGENVARIVERADLRNWRTGLHAGSRRVVEGWVG